jgi:hypothetical protein
MDEKRVPILIAVLSLTMTVSGSQGAAASPSASSSTAAPSSGSIDYNAIYSARTPQQQSESSGQPPIEVTVKGHPSTTATSTIINDQWVSDTLNVYGTVSRSEVIQKPT